MRLAVKRVAVTLVVVILTGFVAFTIVSAVRGQSSLTRNRVSIAQFCALRPEDFIQGEVVPEGRLISFERAYDPKKDGVQTVHLLLEDSEGKEVRVSSKLRLLRLHSPLEFELGKTSFPLTPDQFFDERIGPKTEVAVRWKEPPVASSPGEYRAVVYLDGQELVLPWRAVDRTPPSAKPRTVTGFVGCKFPPAEFVQDIRDATQVTLSFLFEPDWNKKGRQSVELLLTDEGGNQTKITAKLNLKRDKEPPVLEGVKDLVVERYAAVMYREGVRVSDNSGQAELFVDGSETVDTNELGEYAVVYRAVDPAGNETKISAKVSVVAASEQTVRALAEPVLQEILREGMTPKERAQAIHRWLRANIGYNNTGAKNGVLDGAYNGLTLRYGDCYTYYALAKFLLQEVGIESVDLHRVERAKTRHYWLLLNFGSGWLHFDACPVRYSDHPKDGFLMTEREVQRFSNSHRDYYAYDPAILPEGVVVDE